MSRKHDQEIDSLDSCTDHCRIVYLLASCIFPFDIAHSLEFALFRTYAVPRISALLRSTGELTERTRKRYDDTDLLLSELIEYGYDSPRGKAAIANINHQHAKYPIRNDDALYVLSTFVFEPVRWLERFGHRPMTKKERLAWFHFWRAIGLRMNLQDLPAEYAKFEMFNRTYEAERFRFAQCNREVARKTTDLLLGFMLPTPLFSVGRPMIYALLDRPLRKALGIADQPAWVCWALPQLLRIRARVANSLPVHPKTPVLRTKMRRPTYPNGYAIEQLGSESKKTGEET